MLSADVPLISTDTETHVCIRLEQHTTVHLITSASKTCLMFICQMCSTESTLHPTMHRAQPHTAFHFGCFACTVRRSVFGFLKDTHMYSHEWSWQRDPFSHSHRNPQVCKYPSLNKLNMIITQKNRVIYEYDTLMRSVSSGLMLVYSGSMKEQSLDRIYNQISCTCEQR